MATTKLVPPDGGYGWVIVFAFALNNIISIPIMQGFGLVFKDKFKDLGFSSSDTALIMNSSAAISMFCGIFNGPLLKALGYRKVSLISATLTTVGVMLTARANSFFQFIFTHGVITSYGIGIGMSSYYLAISTYFKKNRTKAMGNAMGFAGIGPIIMPQVISFLLTTYGVTGCLTVVSSLAMHTFVSALLLQPIKWHLKEEIIEDDDKDATEVADNEDKVEKSLLPKKLAGSKLSVEEQIEAEALYSMETTLGGSYLSLYDGLPQRSMSVSSRRKSVNSRLAMKDADEKEKRSLTSHLDSQKTSTDKLNKEHLDKIDEQEEEKPKNLLKRIGNALVNFFDLTLLKDPIFLNIMFGMCFAVFAEMNFSLLTPFIMQDFGLNTQQTATFMSTVSVADICFRFIAPYVSDFFDKPTRVMYLWALVLLILSRSSLLLTYWFYGLLGCAFFLGVAKGFRTVYWSLVIPDYVPIERYAAASGLQSTCNSLFMWFGGSFIGFIRDVLGSFRYCILVLNCVTAITIMMWTTEMVYKKLKSRRESEIDIEELKGS